MNAPVPPGSATPENGQPTEEQLELPGFATTNAQDEQDAKDKKRAKEAAAVADFLSWEELDEEIKKTLPDLGGYHGTIHRLITSLNESGCPAVFPRVMDGSPKNNAQIFVELAEQLLPLPKQAFSRLSLQHNIDKKLENDAILYHKSRNGVISVGKSGTFFHAGFDNTGKAKKPFGPVEARTIALLAMHNKDLLPPNAIKITGTPEQRALIRLEVYKLNESLPESLRFNIDDGSKPKAPAQTATQERGPSLVEKIWGKVTGKPVAAAPAAAAAADDVLDLTEENIAHAPTGAGEALGESMAQAMVDEVRGVQAAPEGPSERDVLEETLNQHASHIVKSAEKVGEFDTTDHGRQDLFKARLQTVQATQPPFNGPETMKDVIFHQAGDRLKILAVEGDFMFNKLLEKNVEDQAQSALNKEFGTAGQGETPSLADDENFIGPRTPDGWTPPAPPSV